MSNLLSAIKKAVADVMISDYKHCLQPAIQYAQVVSSRKLDVGYNYTLQLLDSNNNKQPKSDIPLIPNIYYRSEILAGKIVVVALADGQLNQIEILKEVENGAN